jgi:uncharacterized coiled-coil protein SlyX
MLEMGRFKIDLNKITKEVEGKCEFFLQEHGREPNVVEISKMLGMSNSTTNPIVTAWKNARAAAAQVINMPDDIIEKIEEGRKFYELLARDIVAKKDREREAAVNSKETELSKKYEAELDSALFDNDVLTAKVANQETTISNLNKEIEELKMQLVGETTDLKLLIKTLQQQHMLTTLADNLKESDLQKAA